MLRVLMLDLQTAKEDRFTEMMGDFYRTYRGQHASTEDFQRVVEQYAGIDMNWFFKEWVYGTGIPSYRVAYRTERAENGKYRVRLRVTQENVPDDFMMYVPVTVDFGEGREARLRVKVAGPSSEIALPLMPMEPKGLTFNALDGVLCEVKMVAW
jgi:aminopeptidase N